MTPHAAALDDLRAALTDLTNGELEHLAMVSHLHAERSQPRPGDWWRSLEFLLTDEQQRRSRLLDHARAQVEDDGDDTGCLVTDADHLAALLSDAQDALDRGNPPESAS